jgi:hypothetical protein
VYRSKQRSTDLCTDSTGIKPASVSVVDMNYDPLGSLAPPPLFYTTELFRIRSAYVNCFRTQLPRMAEYLFNIQYSVVLLL